MAPDQSNRVDRPRRRPGTARPWRSRLTEPRTLDDAQRRRRTSSAAVLSVVGLAVFLVALVGVLTHSGVQTLDQPVERWFDAQRHPDRTGAMVVLALVFGPIGMPIVVALTLVVWIALARHLWRPLLLLAGMVTGVALAQILAPIIRHPRPPIGEMLLGPDHTFSFPSGHVLGMSDFFLLTAYLLATRIRRRWFTVLAVVLAVGLVLAQIVSRLYLGYHWFTDVTASVGLSMAIVGIVIAVDVRHTSRRPRGADDRTSSGSRTRVGVGSAGPALGLDGAASGGAR